VCILVSGEAIGVGSSLREVGGDDATLASRADALRGLPDDEIADPAESRRDAIGTCVVMQGEETVEGDKAGRRLPDLERFGASMGSV
jgi:hypothetical protein